MANAAAIRLAGTTQQVFGRYARTPVLAPIGFVIFTIGAWVASGHKTSYLVALAITGLGPGAIAALSGMGVILTYRATGVFNFAQGTIATLVGYLYWEMTDNRGLPAWLAAIIAILLIAPIIGVLLDRALFRQLERRGASTSEKLVATLGLTVLTLGICVTVWGQQTQF